MKNDREITSEKIAEEWIARKVQEYRDAGLPECACGTLLVEPYPDGLLICFECRVKEQSL